LAKTVVEASGSSFCQARQGVASLGLVQKTAFSGISTGGQSGSKPTRRTAAEHRDKAKTPRPEMG
jgi:hypothetical protein